jgi:hypothetical protein
MRFSQGSYTERQGKQEMANRRNTRNKGMEIISKEKTVQSRDFFPSLWKGTWR